VGELVLASASGDPPYLAMFWLAVFGLVYVVNQRQDRRRRASRQRDAVSDVDRFHARLEIGARSASDGPGERSGPQGEV